MFLFNCFLVVLVYFFSLSNTANNFCMIGLDCGTNTYVAPAAPAAATAAATVAPLAIIAFI